MEKYYLGFSLGFNSSACLFSSKRGVLSSISQERLSNEKNTKEFPFEAMIRCCKEANVKVVHDVAYSHYQGLTFEEIEKYSKDKYLNLINKVYDKEKEMFTHKALAKMISIVLQEEGIEYSTINEDKGPEDRGMIDDEKSVYRAPHHISHEAACWAIYGKPEKCISIVCDGFGDGLSSLMTFYNKKSIHPMSSTKLVDSVALIYQFVTGALGFKEHQHEGKITGLASYGKPVYMYDFFKSLYTEETLDRIEMDIEEFSKNKEFQSNGFDIDLDKLLPLSEEEEEQAKNSSIVDFDHFLRLKKTVYNLVDELKQQGASRKDLAASVQELAEFVIINWIFSEVYKANIQEKVPCFLSGGLFANVKLNQRVRETGLFSEVLVAPCMGDEGTAIGAAWTISYCEDTLEGANEQIENSMRNVLVGPDIKVTHRKVSDLLVNKGFEMQGSKSAHGMHEAYFKLSKDDKNVNIKVISDLYQSEIIDMATNALAKKKIVCMCRGKMEYGPRALCDRSILYDCTDRDTNNWLNEQLNRTEFMPFAPVCLKEDVGELFVDYKSAERTMKFMTMTFNCTQEFIKNYPAAAHIDGTARPQAISMEDNLFMYTLLQEYKRKTNLKVLINTSFNMHNSPIVCDEDEALESWLKSNTHMLVLGDLILIRE